MRYDYKVTHCEEGDLGLHKCAIRNAPEDNENIKKSSPRKVDQQL